MGSKIIHLKLTGKAKEFVDKLKEENLSEQDIFAKALKLLEDVYETKRVARIKESHRWEDVDAVEFFYGINIKEEEDVLAKRILSRRTPVEQPLEEDTDPMAIP